MADVTGLLLTNLGAAKIAASLSGGAALSLTHVAFGDAGGAPYDPVPTLTQLVNERYRATIAAVAAVDGAIVIDAIIPDDAPDAQGRASYGFRIAECGLFDAGGDLIALARMGDGYKPGGGVGQSASVVYRLILAVANAANVTVVVDPLAQIPLGREVRPQWITVDGVASAPPAGPAIGATFAIGVAPTGAWAGHAGKIAQWLGAVWSLASVPLGHQIADNSKPRWASDYRLERTAAGWERIAPPPPLTLGAGGQAAILPTDHGRVVERDVTAGGVSLPTLAATPLGTEITLRLTGTPAALPMPAITVAGGGNIIWRGVATASMATFGRGEVLHFRRVADGWLMSVLAQSQRAALLATDGGTTWVAGARAYGLIPPLTTVSGEAQALFGFDGQKFTVPVTGLYTIQFRGLFNAAGGAGGAGVAITLGAFVATSLAMNHAYSDYGDTFSMSQAVPTTHQLFAGDNIHFNYALTNPNSRIRPQDFGVAAIYLGR